MGRVEQEKSNYGSRFDQISTGAGILHPMDDLSENTMHCPAKGWGSRAFMHGLLGPCDGGCSRSASAPALPAAPLLSCSCTSCSCSCTSCSWGSGSALPALALPTLGLPVLHFLFLLLHFLLLGFRFCTSCSCTSCLLLCFLPTPTHLASPALGLNGLLQL